jgi:TolB-like protein/Flp pilus assembly protein TadD
MLVAIGVIISAAAGFFLLPRASARKVDKSIAVLPFQNLSDEKENAYFADGVQDDILTNLSKIGDLKVISRMSVMAYREGTRDAKGIGKALGVGSLLEGSVRRVGNRVRVNVQLINAETDEHIWAEDYDRDLTDVFAIQSDLAKKIAAALQARLSPNEKARLDRRPTENQDAYLLFMHAAPYANNPDMFRDDSQKATQLFEQAIKLDPNFAAAYAGLSMVESWVYHSFDPTLAQRQKARFDADEAFRLQPDLPEAHLALGFSYYYGDRDYDRALSEFEIAKGGLPNEAQAYMAIGAIQRRQGKWAESTASLEKAVTLDPKNVGLLVNLGSNYMAKGNFKRADEIFDRAIATPPQSFGPHAMKAAVAVIGRGDVKEAANEIASIPKGLAPDELTACTQYWFLMLERRAQEALQAIQKCHGETVDAIPNGRVPTAFYEGVAYEYQGDKAKASAAFERARAVAEKLVRESPDDAQTHAVLGQILAGLGQKDAAIAEGIRATDLLPESQDAFEGPQITAWLAGIYACVGENDQALRLLDHLLQTPNGITIAMLRLDPTWDHLRKDPRFQALMDKYSSETLM